MKPAFFLLVLATVAVNVVAFNSANSPRAAGYQSSAQQGASDSKVETGSGARSVSEHSGAAPDSQQGEKQ